MAVERFNDLHSLRRSKAMGYVIELKNGQWLAAQPMFGINGTDWIHEARVFRTVEEAKKTAIHLGISYFDVWTEDENKWVYGQKHQLDTVS
jgi:hypothetical protein